MLVFFLALRQELWIQIHRIRIWIQGFDDRKLKKKNTDEIFSPFFDQKLQFTYP